MVLLKPRKQRTSQLVHNLPHQQMVSVGKPSHRETLGASILTSSFFQYIYGAWTPQRTLALIQEKQIKL
jgi:hypothetical protein